MQNGPKKEKTGRTFAFGQELWYTRKKKRGRICMEIRKGTSAPPPGNQAAPPPAMAPKSFKAPLRGSLHIFPLLKSLFIRVLQEAALFLSNDEICKIRNNIAVF